MNTIYSIGHSNKSIETMIEKLKENNIEILVDVRTSPRSRWPQFQQYNLKASIIEAGMTYLFKGKNLGGKGGNIDFHETLDELTELIQQGKRIAIMCSEGNPNDCHRKYMLEPEFTERGVEMEHILYIKPEKASSQISMLIF